MKNQPLKILVIDSDKKFIKSISMYFRTFSGKIFLNSFENAELAMCTVDSESFDVIICDYWLSGMNGIAFFHLIKELQPDSRKILIASYDNFEILNSISDKEINDVISKPLTGSDIEKIIKKSANINIAKRKVLVKKEAREIVRKHVYKSIGVGLIPIPAVDFIGHALIQLNMLRRLAEVYNVPFSKEIGKKMIASMVAGYIPLYSSGLFGSFIKTVPVVGQTVGVANLSIFAATTTYCMGEIFISYFERGGTFLNFQPEKIKEILPEYQINWRNPFKKRMGFNLQKIAD